MAKINSAKTKPIPEQKPSAKPTVHSSTVKSPGKAILQALQVFKNCHLTLICTHIECAYREKVDPSLPAPRSHYLRLWPSLVEAETIVSPTPTKGTLSSQPSVLRASKAPMLRHSTSLLKMHLPNYSKQRYSCRWFCIRS
jgi:hypothetical protein